MFEFCKNKVIVNAIELSQGFQGKYLFKFSSLTINDIENFCQFFFILQNFKYILNRHSLTFKFFEAAILTWGLSELNRGNTSSNSPP